MSKLDQIYDRARVNRTMDKMPQAKTQLGALIQMLIMVVLAVFILWTSGAFQGGRTMNGYEKTSFEERAAQRIRSDCIEHLVVDSAHKLCDIVPDQVGGLVWALVRMAQYSGYLKATVDVVNGETRELTKLRHRLDNIDKSLKDFIDEQ